MKLHSDNISDYLVSNPVVDWDHPAVWARTREILGDSADDVANAKQLFEWVRDKIPHSKDIGSRLVTCSASEVLEKGTGICYAKSHFIRVPPHSGTGVHALNALFLPSIAKWIRVDSRGNTGDIDAQFHLEEEKLAFPVDPAKGELFIYEGVFVDPAPQVVDVLTRFDDLEEMWWHLPQVIDDESLSAEDRALNQDLRDGHWD
jgi:transglutaminase-like putative cysteine protease